jgi:hypothetical protein
MVAQSVLPFKLEMTSDEIPPHAGPAVVLKVRRSAFTPLEAIRTRSAEPARA